jgi:uncharacterized membrane protein YqjE
MPVLIALAVLTAPLVIASPVIFVLWRMKREDDESLMEEARAEYRHELDRLREERRRQGHWQ